jgi:hypothetical protein
MAPRVKSPNAPRDFYGQTSPRDIEFPLALRVHGDIVPRMRLETPYPLPYPLLKLNRVRLI